LVTLHCFWFLCSSQEAIFYKIAGSRMGMIRFWERSSQSFQPIEWFRFTFTT